MMDLLTNMLSQFIDDPDSNLDKSIIIIPSVHRLLLQFTTQKNYLKKNEDENYWDSDNRNFEVVETINFHTVGRSDVIGNMNLELQTKELISIHLS